MCAVTKNVIYISESDLEVWMEDDGDGSEHVREESPPCESISESEEEVSANHLRAWLVKFLVHFQSLFHITDLAMECIL